MDFDEKLKFVQSVMKPMAWHTYPQIAGVIAIESDQTGQHVGSALRLSLDGHRLIVTAAHVIQQARCGGRFAVSALRGQPPFELHGAPERTSEELDVAAYILPPEYPDDGIGFWPAERTDTTEEKWSTDYLFVHGFPGSRSRFSPLLGGLVKESLPYGVMLREDGLPADMSPCQFAMDFDPVNMPTPEGTSGWLDPHGLSGSPVWRIGASGQSADDWQPERSLLVGMVTAWRPDEKLLLATKISPLLQVLRHPPLP